MSSCRLSSVRTYFENGLLKTLVNKNGSGTTIESHTLSYLAGGVYLNANRVSDVFQLKGPDASAPCYAATCTASWSYDARERLTQENAGTGPDRRPSRRGQVLHSDIPDSCRRSQVLRFNTCASCLRMRRLTVA